MEEMPSAMERTALIAGASARKADDEEPVSRSRLDATLAKLSTVLDALSRQMQPVEPILLKEPELPWAVTAAERYPVKDPAKYTDFERKYPPDRFGEEAVDAARVWKIYRDRANELDQDRIDGWNKTLDILLIFAGLFSAVATAFLIDSYKQLQPDYVELLTLVVIAMQTNSTIPKPSDFVPTSLARCTNWLWFTSLSLALVVALFAILAKQWLENYSSQMRSPAASNRKWAWRHLFFSAGLSKWRLDIFISTLPVLLHLSLCFFFVGLVLFMWPVDATIAYTLTAGSAVIFALYILLGVLPIWFASCPTATPLLHQLRRACAEGLDVLYRAWMRLIPERLPVANETSHPALSSASAEEGNRRPLVQLSSPAPSPPNHVWSRPLSAVRDAVLRVLVRSRIQAGENRFVLGSEAEHDSEALHWMITTLPSEDDVAAALDAIGSLPLSLPGTQQNITDSYRLLRGSDVFNPFALRFGSLLAARSTAELDTVGRCMRTALFFRDALPVYKVREQGPGYTGSRWFFIKQFDLFLTAPVAWGFESMSFNRLEEHQPITRISEPPCLPSTLALLAERETRSVIMQCAVIYVCGISSLMDLPFIPSQVTHRALEKALDTAEAAIIKEEDAFRDACDPTPRRMWGSPVPIGNIRLRGIRFWGYILQNRDVLGLYEPRLYQSAFCLTAEEIVKEMRWNDVERPLRISQWLSYLGSEEFALTDWPLSTIHALCGFPGLSGVLYTSDVWDARAGAIIRGIVYQCRRAGTEQLSIRVAQLIHDARLEIQCAKNNILGEIYSSPAAVQHESPLNVLQPGSGVVNRSAWAYALELMPNAPTASALLFVPAAEYSSTLLTLHRCGCDVTTMLDELVGHGRGVALVLLHPKYAVPIARHVMEISPEWWSSTIRELLALPLDQWPSPTGADADDPDNMVYPDAAAFIAAVVREGICNECPQHVRFVGEIGISDEQFEGPQTEPQRP